MLQFDTKQLIVRLLVLVSGQHFQPSTRCRASVSVLSHTPVRPRNALPEDIRATSDSAVFRKQLKTHYFSLAFDAC